jgi:NADH-quinone oxidoreductase subunit K
MLTLNIFSFLQMTSILFFISTLGIILNRKNILITIISLELMLLTINMNFAIFSLYLDDITGQVFVMFILNVAATESAIGLAILTTYFRLRKRIEINPIIIMNR